MIGLPGIFYRPVFWFLMVFALLSLGAIGLEITRIDIRFAVMLQELGQGSFNLFPTVNGIEYADYTSLYLYLSYFTSGFGRWVNLWTLTLPTIVLASYTVAMVVKTGELFRRNVGVAGASLLLISVEFLEIAETFATDMFIAALAITLVYHILKHDQSWKVMACFAIALFSGFWLRGSLGLVVIGAMGAGYWLAIRDWPRFWIGAITGAIVTVICAGLFYLWVISHGGNALWEQVKEWQIYSRMQSSNPFYYYWLDGFATLAPVTYFALVGFLTRRQEQIKKPLLGLWGMILFPVLILSIPGCKHLRYILPTLPVFAILAGNMLLTLPENSKFQKFFDKLLKILGNLAPIIGILTIAVVSTIASKFIAPDAFAPYRWGIAALLLIITLFRSNRKVERGMMDYVLRLGFCVPLVFLAAINPLQINAENSGNFVQQCEAQNSNRIFLYEFGVDHDDHKYTLHAPDARKKYVYVFDELEKITQIHRQMFDCYSSEEKLPQIQPEDLLISRDRNLKRLQEVVAPMNLKVEVLFEGRLGHRTFFAARVLPADEVVSTTETATE